RPLRPRHRRRRNSGSGPAVHVQQTVAARRLRDCLEIAPDFLVPAAARVYLARMSTGRRIGLAIDPVAGYGRGVIRGVMSFCRQNPRWEITVEPRWSFARVPDIDEWEADG